MNYAFKGNKSYTKGSTMLIDESYSYGGELLHKSIEHNFKIYV